MLQIFSLSQNYYKLIFFIFLIVTIKKNDIKLFLWLIIILYNNFDILSGYKKEFEFKILEFLIKLFFLLRLVSIFDAYNTCSRNR